MTSENGNFTPVFHLLAKEVGLVCAAVYGATWRHCQMKDNNCKASLDTLGDEIGVDRATVMRSIKKLCELGYLVDQTPGRRNAPHTYILGKSVAECNTLEVESIAQGNSSSQSVAHSNATVAECNATVAESYLKIDSKETPLRESSPKGEAVKPPTRQKPEPIPAVKVHVEVTGKYLLNTAQIKEVAEVVGDSPNSLEKWRDSVKAWLMHGNKPTNISGQLDWFRNGIPVYKNGGTNGTYSNGPKRNTDPNRIPSQDPYANDPIVAS